MKCKDSWEPRERQKTEKYDCSDKAYPLGDEGMNDYTEQSADRTGVTFNYSICVAVRQL